MNLRTFYVLSTFDQRYSDRKLQWKRFNLFNTIYNALLYIYIKQKEYVIRIMF